MTKEEILKRFCGHAMLHSAMGTKMIEAMQEYATQEKQTPSCDHKNASFYHHGGILKCPDCKLMFEDGKQEKQGWVKTSERLPEEGRTILVSGEPGLDIIDCFIESVTGFDYWMYIELPQKPEV